MNPAAPTLPPRVASNALTAEAFHVAIGLANLSDAFGPTWVPLDITRADLAAATYAAGIRTLTAHRLIHETRGSIHLDADLKQRIETLAEAPIALWLEAWDDGPPFHARIADGATRCVSATRPYPFTHVIDEFPPGTFDDLSRIAISAALAVAPSGHVTLARDRDGSTEQLALQWTNARDGTATVRDGIGADYGTCTTAEILAHLALHRTP